MKLKKNKKKPEPLVTPELEDPFPQEDEQLPPDCVTKEPLEIGCVLWQ